MRKQIFIAAALAFSASTAIAQQQQTERAETPILSAAAIDPEHEACVRKNAAVQRDAKKFCGANLACYQQQIKRGEDATKTCERAMRAGVARHLAGQ